MDDEIYKENLLDHYRNPHNFGKLKFPDLELREFNPVCGDEIELFVNFDNDKVSEVKFSGKGCAISQASTSMLTDFIMSKTKKEISQITKEDVLNLLGIKVGIVRLKCAMLALTALQGGLGNATN